MDFPLPPVGEGLIEAELVRWLVRPGDAVKRGQALVEVMTDKATMEVPAPFAGTITALAASPARRSRSAQVVLSYKPVGGRGGDAGAGPRWRARAVSPPSDERRGSRPAASPRELAAAGPRSTATPTAPRRPGRRPRRRRCGMLARKLGVDLARVRGTGPAGRILLDDLTPFLAPEGRAGRQPAPRPATDTTKLDFGVAGTRVKLVGLRRKIAEHMVEAKQHHPALLVRRRVRPDRPGPPARAAPRPARARPASS